MLLAVIDLLADEPLRRQMEQKLNARLHGYTVRILAADFHVLGFGLDLKDVVIIQQANPDPPVARIARLSASVEWKTLVLGRIVADVRFDRPVVFLNLHQVTAEAKDEVPVEERGWQEALEAVYPVKINELKVFDGELTYADDGPFRPLHLSQVNFRAANIRNIRSRERIYPSEVHLEAVVFDRGRLELDGQADFLAEPHPGVQGKLSLEGVELDYFEPILRRYQVEVKKGALSARGELEYAPSVKAVHLRELVLEDLDANYIHSPRTAAAAKEVRTKVAQAAEKASNAPGVVLRVDQATVTNSSVGFVNETTQPPYRVFVANARLEVTNLSNHLTEGTAVATLTGKFMGSGATVARAHFRPELKGADFDLDLRIDDTQMRGMNDLLRAHGKFDVVAGLFSFYTELTVKNKRIEGYVKPLFRDLDVYEEHQDRHKPAIRRLYERLVDGAAKVLGNRPRDEVATKAELSGPIENPKANSLEIIIGLIQNAFFKAILPGFEQQLKRLRSGSAARETRRS